jgi:hypothetical protein
MRNRSTNLEKLLEIEKGGCKEKDNKHGKGKENRGSNKNRVRIRRGGVETPNIINI